MGCTLADWHQPLTHCSWGWTPAETRNPRSRVRGLYWGHLCSSPQSYDHELAPKLLLLCPVFLETEKKKLGKAGFISAFSCHTEGHSSCLYFLFQFLGFWRYRNFCQPQEYSGGYSWLWAVGVKWVGLNKGSAASQARPELYLLYYLSLWPFLFQFLFLFPRLKPLLSFYTALLHKTTEYNSTGKGGVEETSVLCGRKQQPLGEKINPLGHFAKQDPKN